MKNEIIQKIEQSYISTVTKKIPEDMRAGDTVEIGVKVKEGSKERIQKFEGVLIGMKNKGIGSTIRVRKMSAGFGVERVFPIYSPMVASIEVKRHGVVRRAKLYYLRNLTGKKARIAERIRHNNKAKSE